MKTPDTVYEPEYKILLIVDPQIDFITGTLPVMGAQEAMDHLARYVRDKGYQYDAIIVTADRHGFRHCSFTENGGQWPCHCVESSTGAAIWPALMYALKSYADRLTILYKGENNNKEEYSIFQNSEAATIIDNIIYTKSSGIDNREYRTKIDICGLAGDVCVANTLEDALKRYPNVTFNILSDYIASLDSGMCISKLKQSLISLK